MFEPRKYLITTKWTNDLANEVVRVARGRGGPDARVETEEDWVVVGRLLDLCAKYFPKEVREVLRLNKAIALHQKNKFGLLEDPQTKKGGMAQIRQTGQWPFEFEVLMRVVWPNQKFNRTFNRKLMERFTALKTAEKI